LDGLAPASDERFDLRLIPPPKRAELVPPRQHALVGESQYVPPAAAQDSANFFSVDKAPLNCYGSLQLRRNYRGGHNFPSDLDAGKAVAFQRRD
jgi:hypothetical protein